VWAVKKSLPAETKQELLHLIDRALQDSRDHFGEIGELRGSELGLSRDDVEEYLEGFNFRLGERERAAMSEFRNLLVDLVASNPGRAQL
jgi:predicted solute-binding protein